MIKKTTLFAILFTSLLAEQPYNIINSAVDAHPNVNRQINFYKQVLQDLDIAQSDNLPTLDYRGEIGQEKLHREDSDSSNLAYYKNNLTLRQNLFRGYKTQSEIRQNEARISEAAYTVLDRANTVALDAITAYIEVLKQRDLTKLFEENVQNHEDVLAKIQERMDAGVGKKSEVLQTQSRLDLAYSNLLVQQNNFEDTLTQYHFVVGRFFDRSEYIKPNTNFEIPKNINEASYIALLNNPSIKALKSSIIAKKEEYRKAKSEFYPILDAVASADWENNVDGVEKTKKSMSIGLVARWNLYRGGADEANRLKALESLSEEKKNLRRIQRDVIKQARLAYMAYKVYKPQIKYLEKHLAEAKATLDSYVEEYSLGRRDLLAILDAQKEHNSAQQTLIEAKYNLMLAKYKIANATNELLYTVKSTLPSKLILTSIEDDLTNDDNFARNVLCDNPLDKTSLDKYNCQYTETNLGYQAEEKIVKKEKIEEAPYIEPSPTPVAPVKSEKPKITDIKLRNINFIIYSNKISDDAMKTLVENAKQLKNTDFKTLELHSYTDSSGRTIKNLIRSQNRAEVVKEKLIELGIPKEKIVILAKGSTNFIADNSTKQGRLLNRRVEFKVIN